ncbi:hypothetical protein [Aurantibacillus circumpalustris]|uniref:hypothetical protein n=1 Tax=Aurantibacillus circumpalustris TaxID=3036359 RepID=UPI00295B7D34|nr:hypothetical protein [Aurantibacillus circumpalustris]
MKKLIYLLFFVNCICNWSCGKKEDEYKNLDCSSINASYTSTIKPLIDANCTSSGCHDAKSSNGNLTTYEGLIIRVNNGTLSKRVLYTKDMPKRSALSLEDRERIKCWLDAGAPRN